MAKRGWRRKILRLLGILFGGTLLIVLALPLWFPWAFHPLAQKLRIQYVKYEREGYTRFVLVDATFTASGTRLRAERVEALVPTAWLWHHFVDRDPVTCVNAQNWTLDITANTNVSRAPARSVFTVVNRLAPILATVGSWVPKALLTNGTVQVGNQRAGGPWLQLRVTGASWVNGVLSAGIEFPKYSQKATVRAKLGAAPYGLVLDCDSLHLHSQIDLSANAAGLSLRSTNVWLDNRVGVSAQFGRSGIWPEEAAVHADSLRIPANLLELNNFEDLTGSLSFQWQHEQFACNVAAAARPLGPSNLPPIDVLVHTTGSTASAFIETAKISCPWLRAELSPGMEVKFTAPFFRQEAVFKLALDLSKQPWFAASGKLDGQVRLRPAQDKFPAADFVFSGSGIAVSNIFHEMRNRQPTIETKSVSLSGGFVWPWLDISRLAIDLTDGSTASLNGQFHVQQRIVRDGHLQFKGRFVREFLPAGLSFDSASGNIRFNGPLQTMVHSGEFAVQNLTTPALNPIGVQGTWTGEGTDLRRSQISAQAGKSSLELEVLLLTTNTEMRLTIQTLTLQRERRPWLELQNPCQITLLRPLTNTASVLQVEPVRWQGGGGSIALEALIGWPVSGHVVASARLPSLVGFEDFLKVLPRALGIEELNLATDWNNGPATLTLGLAVTQQGYPFSARASLEGDAKGLSVKSLEISTPDRRVFDAHGFLPLEITPGQPKPLHFISGQPLDLQIMTETNSVFWDEVAAATGVVLLEPNLTANISGTWQSPLGRVEGRVKRIKWATTGRTNAPSSQAGLRSLNVEDVRLALELNRETAQLKNLSALIEGQPATFTADMPLGGKFWTALEAGKPPLDWETVRGRLKIENAKIAAVARLLPKVFSPEGRLNLDLALRPGATLDGELRVTGASTRPLSTFGAIREIELKMKFLGREIELNSVTASIGGAPISASGKVDLRGDDWLKGVAPPFELKLLGQNVPLVRNPDVVIRSDITALVTKTRSAHPLITGVVRVRDSFYLRDLKDLLPSGVASPGARPPYFSIDVEPLADWRLNVDVKGDRCLKVYSPLFHGVISSDLKVTGTLKDPLALGQVKIDSGQVQLPFANLEVKQGLVTLSSENPYQPQLLLSAAARRANFDVKMEVSGPATQPLIQFSSTPPLGSEQIVLMLTAGQLPRSEYTLSTQQKAQTLALYVGKNLLSQFGFGHDSERLSIQTGENISETGSLTYHVEYKLSERWYLVGEYDRFNALNVGIKWRIYSK